MSEITPQNQNRERIENIDKIRDIIFGSHQREYEGRFEQLEASLSTFEAEVRSRLDQLERSDKNFSKTIEALDEIVYKQTTSLKQEISVSRDKLEQDILALKNQVLQELERRFSLLKEDKTSKSEMADILMEMGLRLQGTALVPGVKEAIQSAADDNQGKNALLLLEQSQTLE
ncbi:MAG: hypothetical protein F6K41_43020 [Symploca sp. SIO3E6]|nr:hypothetical protein [Caldora sp. SIO3E6]